MKLRSLRGASVAGKRVLVRAGFNVPLTASGRVADDWRIRRGLATIRWLTARRCRVVVISHLGRPEGKRVSRYSLRPVAGRLSQLLRKPVGFAPDCVGGVAARAVSQLQAGQVLLLENLRFHSGEERNDRRFAKQLASLADFYVDDAFENAHRDHASMVAITRELRSVAGLLLSEEVSELTRVLTRPRRPFVAIIGGAKISTKIGLLKTLLPKVDKLLLGGALANTVLRGHGLQVGKSLVEPAVLWSLRELPLTSTRLSLPVDVVVASRIAAHARTSYRPVGKVRRKDIILDIGPDTQRLFSDIIAAGRTIIWNGPLGYTELPAFAAGTQAIARAVARSRAESVVGGGETCEALKATGTLNRISFVSTGGGAMLEFLEGKLMPALRPLMTKTYAHN